MGAAADRTYQIQVLALLGLLVLFVVLTVGATKSMMPMLAVVILSSLAVVVARMCGTRSVSFLEPGFVWYFGLVGLVIIGFERLPSIGAWAPPLWSVGSFCILAAWALHREPLVAPRRDSQRLAEGRILILRAALIGFAGGVILSVLGTSISVIGMLAGAEEAFVGSYDRWLPVVLSYLVGGLGAGAVVGALQPLNRWPLGVMFIGAAAFAVFATAEDWIGDPRGVPRLLDALGTGAAVGGLAGPMIGLMVRVGIGERGAFIRRMTGSRS